MNTNPSKTLKEIKILLNLLEGVTVLETSDTINRLHILLTIESHESHLLLVYCAEAANVHLHCWSCDKPGSNKAVSNPAGALRYSYHANSQEGESGEALESFNFLGAFLVWTMYKTGIISGDEEKKLVKLFNAASRST